MLHGKQKGRGKEGKGVSSSEDLPLALGYHRQNCLREQEMPSDSSSGSSH